MTVGAQAHPARSPLRLGEERVLVRLHAVASPPGVAVDAAGVVTQVGRDVSELCVGDRVMGRFPVELLAGRLLSPYCSVPHWWALAPIPPSLSFAAAAACISPGLSALAAVDAVQPQPGARVLVLPGAHPVSVLVIRLVRARRATVITSGTADQAAFLSSLGAGRVIDISEHDVNTRVRQLHPDGVDAIVDAAGDSPAVSIRAGLLRAGGRLAALAGWPRPEGRARCGRTAVRVLPRPTASSLVELAWALEHGALRA